MISSTNLHVQYLHGALQCSRTDLAYIIFQVPVQPMYFTFSIFIILYILSISECISFEAHEQVTKFLSQTVGTCQIFCWVMIE